MGRETRVIGYGKRTTARLNASPSDAFVLDHDKVAGFQQQLHRVKKREAMGVKKTPTGRSVTIKRK